MFFLRTEIHVLRINSVGINQYTILQAVTKEYIISLQYQASGMVKKYHVISVKRNFKHKGDEPTTSSAMFPPTINFVFLFLTVFLIDYYYCLDLFRWMFSVLRMPVMRQENLVELQVCLLGQP